MPDNEDDVPAGKMPDTDTMLGAMFREHHGRVFTAAYRITGSASDAEDVLQTVFLNVLKSETLNASALDANPAGYLCRAAINSGLDLLRSRRRVRIVDVEEIERDQASNETQQVVPESVHIDELRGQLRQALSRVDARAAEIVALRYFEGYGNAEIADMLESTPSSIAVTLHRTRERLKAELAELQGVDHE